MELHGMMGEWQRWSFGERLKNTTRLVVLLYHHYFKGISPSFICFLLVLQAFELYVYESWRGLVAITSHLLIWAPSAPYIPLFFTQISVYHYLITLNFTTFASMLAFDLPYILAYVDLELRPSLFTVCGLISFIVCFSTVVDAVLYIYVPDWFPHQSLQMQGLG